MLLLGLVALCLEHSLQAQSSEELRARFLREAPPAWEEYAAFCDRLQGSIHGAWTGGTNPPSGFVEFKSNAGSKMILFQRLGGGHTDGMLRVFNPVYGFTLKRKDKDAGWVLEKLEVGEKRRNLINWLKDAAALRVCVRPWSHDLAELVQRPTFRVLSVSAVQRDGKELIQVDFEDPHSNPDDQPWYPTQSGSLVLDPNRFWTVHSCTLRNRYEPGDNITTVSYELRDASAKYPIPKRFFAHIAETTSSGGRQVSTETREYDLKEPSRPPGDEEFTLSAFELPEPMGVPRVGSRPTPWYLWFGLAALVSLVLAVVCKRLANHYRQQQPTAQSAKPTSPNEGKG